MHALGLVLFLTYTQLAFASKCVDVKEMLTGWGYTDDRSINTYFYFMTKLESRMKTMGESDRWLDLGAGRGHAIVSQCARECVFSATGISFESEASEEMARLERSSQGKFRLMTGRLFGEIPKAELGTFDVITDFAGVFSYADNISKDLGKALSLLNIGGEMHIAFDFWNSLFIHNEGQLSPDHGSLEQRHAIEHFLKAVRGVDVEILHEKSFLTTRVGYVIFKRTTQQEITVPMLKLTSYIKSGSNYPARRTFIIGK